MYTNFSIVDPNNKNPYFDTPSPKVFGNVSPMDPQLFMRINDFAGELLKGERSGKYSPIEYAQWIEDYADAAAKHLAAGGKQGGRQTKRLNSGEWQLMWPSRWDWADSSEPNFDPVFSTQSSNKAAIARHWNVSLKMYQKARGYWAELANRAQDVYKSDITVGEMDLQRGHWLDRLPAIDEDIALMAKKLEQTQSSTVAQQDNVRLAIQEAMGRPVRASAVCHHIQPERFQSGRTAGH